MYNRNDEMVKIGLESKLIYAVARNDLETIKKKLLGVTNRQLNMKYASYENPLILATNENNIAVVKLLIDAGANIEVKDAIGCTPLVIALKESHEELAYLLIKHNANICRESSRKISTLHYAAIACSKLTIEYLLNKGLDVNYLSKDQLSPLDFTIDSHSKGNIEAASTLVENGSSKTVITNAFRRACWMGNDKIAALLLDKGADANIVMGENGNNPEILFWLCRMPRRTLRTRYLKTIRLLLTQGVNFKNKYKFNGSIINCDGSPLQRALEDKFYDAVNLIQYGRW